MLIYSIQPVLFCSVAHRQDKALYYWLKGKKRKKIFMVHVPFEYFFVWACFHSRGSKYLPHAKGLCSKCWECERWCFLSKTRICNENVNFHCYVYCIFEEIFKRLLLLQIKLFDVIWGIALWSQSILQTILIYKN